MSKPSIKALRAVRTALDDDEERQEAHRKIDAIIDQLEGAVKEAGIGCIVVIAEEHGTSTYGHNVDQRTIAYAAACLLNLAASQDNEEADYDHRH
ncbi:MAG: hypothetical protein KGL39_04020 [Patescibacteria group bacterium]|nr:hypothetical protein [Patescibacteria group bacterium]